MRKLFSLIAAGLIYGILFFLLNNYLLRGRPITLQYAAVCGAVFAGALYLFSKIGRSLGKLGVNLDLTQCPKCAIELPVLRRPKNLREVLWGGFTCRACGHQFDKWGKEILK